MAYNWQVNTIELHSSRNYLSTLSGLALNNTRMYDSAQELFATEQFYYAI
jgi:hypothetical protein